MQLLPILLVAAVMAVDGGLRPIGEDWGLSYGQIAVIACAPIAVILLFITLGLLWCERRLCRGKIPSALTAADRLARIARVLIILNHFVAVFVFGWLGAVRFVVGDLILLDELIAITPALIGLIGVWWAYYPIDRRMHQALLIRHLDEGRTIYPMLSRTGFVMLQVRMQLLLLLVPVLAIAMLSELIGTAGEIYEIPESSQWVVDVGKVAAGAGVFMIAPLLARVVLDVKPMPAGPLRETLLEVCNRHKIRIRELLVWNTNGSMFNAAVMGLIGRLRYVMITDALLETMPEEQVRAVMAHEIGHVRRHHMPWMVGCLIASFLIAAGMLALPKLGLMRLSWITNQVVYDGVSLVMSGFELALALLLFGWICRRFERQADTFAVQHLSAFDAPATPNDSQWLPDQEIESSHGTSRVRSDAVHAMCGALDNIAHLNSIDHDRPSWRHGSISWRMEYLLSIIGRPVSNLPIDRVVRRIKLSVALVLLLWCGYAIFAYWQTGHLAS